MKTHLLWTSIRYLELIKHDHFKLSFMLMVEMHPDTNTSMTPIHIEYTEILSGFKNLKFMCQNSIQKVI